MLPRQRRPAASPGKLNNPFARKAVEDISGLSTAELIWIFGLRKRCPRTPFDFARLPLFDGYGCFGIAAVFSSPSRTVFT
jgi:hypothetical protein